jgi:hypothetical protein
MKNATLRNYPVIILGLYYGTVPEKLPKTG